MYGEKPSIEFHQATLEWDRFSGVLRARTENMGDRVGIVACSATREITPTNAVKECFPVGYSELWAM